MGRPVGLIEIVKQPNKQDGQQRPSVKQHMGKEGAGETGEETSSRETNRQGDQ